MPTITPANLIAAVITLIPLLVAAFFPGAFEAWGLRCPLALRLVCPAFLSVPYLLVTISAGFFRGSWFVLYALLPVAIAVLLWQAGRVDPVKLHGDTAGRAAPGRQQGNWRDFLVLAVLGLAVDLRWFEAAWPPHLAIFSKMVLLDAGIYGFIVLRQLEGAGFDLRLRLRDAAIGLRELVFYTPLAIALGLWLGFLHTHAVWPGLARICVAWIFTFFFIAVPEELFFRGWVQNLLEQRVGRYRALLLTAVLFGLSHFNKRAVFFNWRYVLLAALAGIFYGRAWRQDRRVAASSVTHASVDAIWSLWFR